MLRIRLGLLALAGLAALAGALAPVVARAEPALQIVVLLREHAGRDADLDARPITDAELEALARAAALPLERSRVEAGGAQVLSLPAASTDAERAAILRSLRALPQVLWAEEVSAFEAEAGPSRPFADIDRLIVKLTDRRSRDDSDAGRPMPQETVRELSRRAGVSLYYERPVSGGAYALRLFQRMPPESVAAIAARLEADPAVAYAEPSVRGRFGAVPDDPLFPQQWPLFAPGGGIRAPAAWERTTGDPSIVIAVVDSGILPDHPDLRGRLLPGWDFVSDVRRSNDLDGRDADPTDPGDATVTSECASGSPPSPSTWHGTHVAGTIGAASDNGLGVAGVDWQARILPARVGAKCGIDPIDLVDAVRWVAGAGSPKARIPETTPNANPARIINLSMEFPGRCPRSLQDAITDAIDAGALVVVAAGNAAAPAETFHPGNCRGVVTVHATDRDGARASYSNYGKVDLSAPGGGTSPDPEGGVLSTSFAGERGAGSFDYGFKVGTSMAAPIVSGVAALVLSVRPTLRPGELRDLLVETARPFPTGTTSDCVADGPLSCGSGIVDAAAAVAAAARGVASSSGARSTSGDGG